MKLAALTGNCHVNPQDVSSVYLPEQSPHVIVAMRTGEKHYVDQDYGKSRSQTLDRIVKTISSAGAA